MIRAQLLIGFVLVALLPCNWGGHQYLSEWTVRTHVRNILGKLHPVNRTQAALFALREGLAELNND